jgi:hypothetical protein
MKRQNSDIQLTQKLKKMKLEHEIKPRQTTGKRKVDCLDQKEEIVLHQKKCKQEHIVQEEDLEFENVGGYASGSDTEYEKPKPKSRLPSSCPSYIL